MSKHRYVPDETHSSGDDDFSQVDQEWYDRIDERAREAMEFGLPDEPIEVESTPAVHHQQEPKSKPGRKGHVENYTNRKRHGLTWSIVDRQGYHEWATAYRWGMMLEVKRDGRDVYNWSLRTATARTEYGTGTADTFRRATLDMLAKAKDVLAAHAATVETVIQDIGDPDGPREF
jgi:hypothetical protein